VGRRKGGILEGSGWGTLNIKNLADAPCEKLKARAKRERRSVAQEVTGLLAAALGSPPALSTMELQGLGKEFWRDVNAAEYVESQPAAWD
jgi:plasmid stability protein